MNKLTLAGRLTGLLAADAVIWISSYENEYGHIFIFVHDIRRHGPMTREENADEMEEVVWRQIGH